MPLVHIHLREGKPSKYIEEISQSVHQSLVNTLTSKENPQISNFQTISQYPKHCFVIDKNIFGVERSDDTIFICVSATKITSEMKRNLFEELVQQLGKAPKIRKEDIFVNIVELERDNWFVGV